MARDRKRPRRRGFICSGQRDRPDRGASGGFDLAGGRVGAAFREAATPDRVREVEAALFELAVGGDVAAARAWLDRAMDRPLQGIEISGPEGKPLDVATVAAVVLDAIGPDQAARIRVAAAFARLGRADDGPGGGG